MTLQCMNKRTKFRALICCEVSENSRVQLGPKYDGQLNHMAEPISHPVRPLVRRHDAHHYPTTDGRLRRTGQCRTARTLFRTFLMAL